MGSPCTRVSRVREVSSESGGISGPYVTRPIARAVVLGGPVPRSATYEPRVPRVAQYPNGPRAFPRSAANNRVCTGVRLQPHSKRCGRSSSHRCILQPQRALLRDPASLSGRGSQRQAHDPRVAAVDVRDQLDVAPDDVVTVADVLLVERRRRLVGVVRALLAVRLVRERGVLELEAAVAVDPLRRETSPGRDACFLPVAICRFGWAGACRAA